MAEQAQDVMDRKERGLYIMSVASGLSEMHPQTLRKYERAGLIEPPRSGGLRLYSEDNITQLKLIKHLVDDLGLNIAGVELALNLAARLVTLRASLASTEKPTRGEQAALQQVDDILRELNVDPAEAIDSPQAVGRRRQSGAKRDRKAVVAT
jgi:MerR family transcriptional regulator/heat shock protein HspR